VRESTIHATAAATTATSIEKLCANSSASADVTAN